MRFITAPADFQFELPQDPAAKSPPKYELMTFSKYVVESYLDDIRFGRSYKTMKSNWRLERAFSGAAAGDVIALDDADYDLLLEVVSDRPEGTNYVPKFARRLMAFLDAIVEAAKEDPRTKRADGAPRATAS